MGKLLMFPGVQVSVVKQGPTPAPAPAPAAYETTADVAKRVRAALKAAFPGVKFSVRSDNYSGGSSIRVAWTDGPTEKRAESVTAKFEHVRRDHWGEILSGGNRFVSLSRHYTAEMWTKARERSATIPADHPAYRYPEIDGSPNLHVVLAEMEG